jgi:hypothetical protein
MRKVLQLLCIVRGLCHGCAAAAHAQALAWMRGRELHSDALGRGVLHLHPAWVQLVTENGTVIYVETWVECGVSQGPGGLLRLGGRAPRWFT